MEVDRSDLLQQWLGTRRLDPQLPQLLQEHLEQLEATGLEATDAGASLAFLYGLIAHTYPHPGQPTNWAPFVT